MTRATHSRNEQTQAERACVVHLQTDISLALILLHLAEAACKVGNNSRAAQLIEKAALSYKAALRHLENVSTEFDQDTNDLRDSARKLFEAIHVATFHYAPKE